jgi:hypothetical protein
MDERIPSLEKLIGSEIIARIPVVDEHGPALMKLVSLEHGGIWIESQKVTEHFLSEMSLQDAPRAFVVFVPYQQIAWILSFADYPALSEKALGLQKS